jgi:hypothetical protein
MEKNNKMLHIYKTAGETIKRLADYFVQTVNTAIKEKGRCTVVLSGGNSPKKLYELLTTPDYSRKSTGIKFIFSLATNAMFLFLILRIMVIWRKKPCLNHS